MSNSSVGDQVSELSSAYEEGRSARRAWTELIATIPQNPYSSTLSAQSAEWMCGWRDKGLAQSRKKVQNAEAKEGLF